MATASWIQPSCGYLLESTTVAKRSTGTARRFSSGCSVAAACSSASSPSSSSSSCFCDSSHNSNFASGISKSWRYRGLRAQAMSATVERNYSSSKGNMDEKNDPDHLIVLVHGILASPSDWIYVESKLKRRLGRKFLIYASSSNTYTKTFAGIDGAGKRLAEEVMQVVQKSKSLKKISFLAHSLGGLFARYAVAVLYSAISPQASDDSIHNSGSSRPSHGTIAGLEPINFITLATPHLGVRGRKQLPFLLGVPFLEKLAAPIAPFIVRRTGRQLFLTDGKPDRPPLLLRMASDAEDLKFLSALGTFRCRVVYANVSYDHMVGWRTSSIRRETELVKIGLCLLGKHAH